MRWIGLGVLDDFADIFAVAADLGIVLVAILLMAGVGALIVTPRAFVQSGVVVYLFLSAFLVTIGVAFVISASSK